jgi:hypothetical protein
LSSAPADSLPDGYDVIDFFSRLASPVWITAVGAVTDAEVATAVEGAETFRVTERAHLVSLSGLSNGPLMAVLAVGAGANHRVVAGRLLRAQAVGIRFIAVSTSGRGPVPAVTAPPRGVTGNPVKPPPKPEDEADELPEVGDRIDHFVFGLCDVMVVTGERLKLRGVENGKLRDINVGPFHLSKPVVLDGKRVFKLVKRG